MSQQYKIGTHKTTIATENGITRVTYHQTNIVSFNEHYIVLNTGGYSSNTTKTRMNQTSHQFELGYRVYQKNFGWFVEYRGNTYKYENNKIGLSRKDNPILDTDCDVLEK